MPVNQYAPFYSWVGPGGMNQFLRLAPRGNPRRLPWTSIVRTWQTVGASMAPYPPGCRSPPRDVMPVDPGEALDGVVSRLLDCRRLPSPTTLTSTPSLSGSTCSPGSRHFALWNGEPPHEEPGDRYDVLHLAAEAGSLPEWQGVVSACDRVAGEGAPSTPAPLTRQARSQPARPFTPSAKVPSRAGLAMPAGASVRKVVRGSP